MVRILRIGGQALIYVWAMEQEKDGVKSNYLKNYTGNTSVTNDHPNKNCNSSDTSAIAGPSINLPVHVNRTQFKSQDMLVPWHLKAKDSLTQQEEVHYRYYHIFRGEELKNLVAELEGVIVKDFYYDRGNWCIILQKTAFSG